MIRKFTGSQPSCCISLARALAGANVRAALEQRTRLRPLGLRMDLRGSQSHINASTRMFLRRAQVAAIPT
jgi:hypothetical protein